MTIGMIRTAGPSLWTRGRVIPWVAGAQAKPDVVQFFAAAPATICEPPQDPPAAPDADTPAAASCS